MCTRQGGADDESVLSALWAQDRTRPGSVLEEALRAAVSRLGGAVSVAGPGGPVLVAPAVRHPGPGPALDAGAGPDAGAGAGADVGVGAGGGAGRGVLPSGAQARLLEEGAAALDAAVAAERELARAAAVRARALAEFAGCRPAAWDRGPGERGAASAAARAARPAVLAQVSEWAVAEVAARLRLSARAAEALLVESVELVGALPGTLAALQAGRISWAQARVLVELLGPVAVERKPLVEARVLARASGQTVAALRECTRRAIARIDAQAAVRRLAAAVRGRRVLRCPGEDGLDSLTALLPAPVAIACYDALRTMARACAVDAEGRADPRGLDERMADCLADLILRPDAEGRPPVRVALTVVAGADTLTGAGPHAEEPGEVEGQTVAAPLIRELAYTLGLLPRRPTATDLATPAEPGAPADRKGHADPRDADPRDADPRDADPQDAVAEDAVAGDAVAGDEGGAALAAAVDRARARAVAAEQRAAALEAAERAAAARAAAALAEADRAANNLHDGPDPLDGPDPVHEAVEAVPDAGPGPEANLDVDADAAGSARRAVAAAAAARARAALAELLDVRRLIDTALAERPRIAVVDQLSGCLLALTDSTELRAAATTGRGLAPPQRTDRYQPSAALDRFVRLRDRRCRFPGCRARIRRCDLDHRVPYPRGATCHHNLHGLCEHHHRLSHQAPGWHLSGSSTGGLVWTLPGGTTLTTTPPPFGTDDDNTPPPTTRTGTQPQPADHDPPPF